MTNAPREGLALPPDGGKKLSILGYEMICLLRAENSEGRLGVVEFRFPAGMAGPPLHTDDHDEGFLVLEGEMKFQVADQVVAAPAGAFIFAPRGVLHTFETEAAAPARVVTMFSPGGFERFFEEVDKLSAQGVSERARFMELAGSFGTNYIGPPLWRR